MKTKFILVLALLVFAFSCQDENEVEKTQIEQTVQEKLLTVTEVNSQISNTIDQTGTFNWKEASNQLLWSATVHGDHILTVGYGEEDESFRTGNNSRLNRIKNDIIQLIESGSTLTDDEKIVIYQDDTLNYIDVIVKDLEIIEKLRANPLVRYIEPDGFVFDGFMAPEKSNSGCDKSGEYISASDYGRIAATNAKIPWNFYDHKIDQAWAYSKGRGVGVGVIDTGLSSSQANLSYKFDDYYSGRYVRKYGTYVDSWKWWSTRTDGPNDRCGHGTSASSAIAAPNNNTQQMVGVAYECNLISYRGTSDVVLNRYHERKGVANALVALGRRSDVKIISMSIGYPWSIGRVRDAVRYAYARNKMIFAAGGTSTSYTNWYPVIFPASMSETVAVTGVEEQASYDECDVCHTGSQIDFTFVMERGNNNHQPVLGHYTGQSQYFGGSSVATASTAGVAALVWSRYPNWSRAQVLQRLKQSAHFYPNKNNDFGYGNINALKAVRGY